MNVNRILLAAVVFCPTVALKGSIAVLEVNGDRVEIVRDGYGIPHVYASTIRGLFYGDGYAIAQDRLFQMERFRRDARGMLAEMEGPEALGRDRETRRLGYTAEELRRLFNRMESEDRAIFEAYKDGINGWMTEAKNSGKLPDGFTQRDVTPGPWDVIDSVAIGVVMAHRFGSGGAGELRNMRLLEVFKQKFGAEKAQLIFDQLWWRNDPNSPTSITEANVGKLGTGNWGQAPISRSREIGACPQFPRCLSPISIAERRAEMREILAYAEAYHLPTKFGSYAIAIASKRSISGHVLLVGGPQMGFMTPQIAHEVHLSGAGFNVIGMGFAGLPGVLIGHNDHLAWTTTSGVTDLVDIFVEKLDPENKYRYFYKGQYRDMERRKEIIAVRDGAPVEMEVARTIHGPILEWDEKTGVAYSISATFRGRELDTMKAMMGFNRAKSVQEFAKYAAYIWLTHNFFAADREGNIGFWHCGKPPLRAPGIDHRLPTPGTGEYDWKGVMRFKDVPQAINPSRGYVVNWNNKPAPWWDNSDSPVWGEIFRIHRIDQLIQMKPKLGVEHLREILIDIASNDANADYLKPHILAAVDRVKPQDPEVNLAAAFLKAWDNHAQEESVGKTIFDAWLAAVREEIFKEQLGDILDKGSFERLLQPSAILHQLKGPNAAFPLKYDFLSGRSPDQVIVQALTNSVGVLKAKNPQMSAWRFQGGNINFRPLPPIPFSNRGTYIQIVELSPVVRGISILPPGQSEDPHSPHYSDQRELAGYWRFKEMLTDRKRLTN